MILNIALEEDDDRVFVAALSSLIAQLAADRKPSELYVTRVSKWFDHKWLRFSGRGRVRLDGLRPQEDTALDVFWQEHLTFPPFSPRQVSAPLAWSRARDGAFRRVPKPRLFHKAARRHSAGNLQSRVASFSDSALFVWFSSLTAQNGIASVLAYGVSDGVEEAWYASFRKDLSWRIAATKGINRERLQECFPLG